jgi:hypothetical protein
MKTTKTIKSGEHMTTIHRVDGWNIRVYSYETRRHVTRCVWSDGHSKYVQFGGSFWRVSETEDRYLAEEYAEVTETTEPETTEAEQVAEATETTEGKTFAQEWRERIVESLPVIYFIKDNRTRPALAAADLKAGMTVYASGNCVDSIITSVELSKTGKTVTISDRTCAAGLAPTARAPSPSSSWRTTRARSTAGWPRWPSASRPPQRPRPSPSPSPWQRSKPRPPRR